MKMRKINVRVKKKTMRLSDVTVNAELCGLRSLFSRTIIRGSVRAVGQAMMEAISIYTRQYRTQYLAIRKVHTT